MVQSRNYASKKKGKTEVYPIWNMNDIKKLVNWFEDNEEWDGYLITMLDLLLGRRIGDTISFKWSDFYYKNGRRKESMDTVIEQKTGKVTSLHISNMVWEAIGEYIDNTGIIPEKIVDEFIFNYPSKTEWEKRATLDVYNEDNLDFICDQLGKDWGDKRKLKICKDFEKQKVYKTIGQYIYYVVEWNDVLKWHQDAYRKLLNKAIVSIGLNNERISTHSLRKSFGYWIYKMHQFDPDCLLTLQKMFNHADLQTTMAYIGLTEEKTRRYLDDHGQFIKNVLDGKGDEIIKNMPVIPLKSDDLGKIFRMLTDDVDLYQKAINMANELRVC